jgi:hypothetical protein
MAIDVDLEFRRGGKTMLDFLSYCVIAYHMEPVFAFLVGEYRMRPTPERALALFDTFCATMAPARMRLITEVLPPRNVRFDREMENRRQQLRAALDVDATLSTGKADVAPICRQAPIPPTYLFDFIVAHMASSSNDPISAPGRHFDPALTPAQNLPGGLMTRGQRAFVENVWRPRVNPMLVATGFWRIADIP